jgi:predicted nucleotidyltransferase
MKAFSEISTILRDHTEELRSRFGITNLALFGSVARGEATQRSDVDILADVVRPISLFEIAGAENYLIDLLGCEVDLVLRRSVRPELREGILREAVAV